MATCNFISANCTRYFVLGMNKYYSKEEVEENGLDPELVGEYNKKSFQAFRKKTGRTLTGTRTTRT